MKNNYAGVKMRNSLYSQTIKRTTLLQKVALRKYMYIDVGLEDS
jgi:hypothetical protein